MVKAQSKSNDQSRQQRDQSILNRKIKTSIKTGMLAVFMAVLFIAMPVMVFGQADQNALRNFQDMRAAQEEAKSQMFSQLGLSNLVPATDDGDLVILSHGFEDDRFSSSIIGEILNNDTRSYDKYDVDIYTNFRDATGRLISSEQGFIDAETLYPQDSSAFDIFIFGDDIADRASTYDLIINDNRVVQGQPLDEEFEAEQSEVGEEDEEDVSAR